MKCKLKFQPTCRQQINEPRFFSCITSFLTSFLTFRQFRPGLTGVIMTFKSISKILGLMFCMYEAWRGGQWAMTFPFTVSPWLKKLFYSSIEKVIPSHRPWTAQRSFLLFPSFLGSGPEGIDDPCLHTWEISSSSPSPYTPPSGLKTQIPALRPKSQSQGLSPCLKAHISASRLKFQTQGSNSSLKA